MDNICDFCGQSRPTTIVPRLNVFAQVYAADRLCATCALAARKTNALAWNAWVSHIQTTHQSDHVGPPEGW